MLKRVLTLVVITTAITLGAVLSPSGAANGETMCGDVNDNGSGDAVDAQLILMYDAGLVETLQSLPGSDVNSDAKVNSIDASLILQAEAGIIPWDSLTCP